MKINISRDNIDVDKNILDALKKVFKKIKDKKSMELIFVSKNEIKRLNKTYRNIDSETDVLSFEDDSDLSLGDVFICLEVAIKQANDFGHSLLREIPFLAVHGYLHLKGYDHETQEDESKMMEKTESILLRSKLKEEK